MSTPETAYVVLVGAESATVHEVLGTEQGVTLARADASFSIADQTTALAVVQEMHALNQALDELAAMKADVAAKEAEIKARWHEGVLGLDSLVAEPKTEPEQKGTE